MSLRLLPACPRNPTLRTSTPLFPVHGLPLIKNSVFFHAHKSWRRRFSSDSAVDPLCCASARSDMASADGDNRTANIASSIRVIPDFPKPGIMFQDITTLLLEPEAFKDCIDLFVERYKDKKISVVAGDATLLSSDDFMKHMPDCFGIEARGFIFGPPIALALGAKFVPLRKPNKLPGEVISEEYSLEYGTDRMEMHVGALQEGERALIIDDIIATGGTLCAAVKLLERVGAEVVECACVMELPELNGRKKLGDRPLFVLVQSL